DVIKARADAATEGPWRVHAAGMGIRGATTPYAWILSPDNGSIAERHSSGTMADCEFVAAARTDVPALLAEVERLRARVAEVEGERDAPIIETSNTDLRASLSRVIRERDSARAELASLRERYAGL